MTFLSSAMEDDTAKRNGDLGGRVPGAHAKNKRRSGRETQMANHKVFETEKKSLVGGRLAENFPGVPTLERTNHY